MNHISHTTLCEVLGIPESIPDPAWTSYAVRYTIIKVYVEGHAHPMCWGGGHACGSCGFGIDITPEAGTPQFPGYTDTSRCPRCGWGGPNRS